MEDHLTLVELAALGSQTLAELAKQGRLRPQHIWMSVAGAQKYREAIRKGDLASLAHRLERGGTCGGCSHRTLWEVDLAGQTYTVGYCGQPFTEEDEECGCLVTLRLPNGKELGVGRAAVASMKCPLSDPRWSPAPRSSPSPSDALEDRPPIWTNDANTNAPST